METFLTLFVVIVAALLIKRFGPRALNELDRILDDVAWSEACEISPYPINSDERR